MGHSEAPYSITFRTGKGNLFTVRGETAEELALNLGAAQLPVSHNEDGPASVLDMIVTIEASLTGGTPAGGSQPQGGTQQQENLNPRCKVCNGETEFKSGTGSRGPWKAYFCLSGDKTHKPQWL